MIRRRIRRVGGLGVAGRVRLERTVGGVAGRVGLHGDVGLRAAVLGRVVGRVTRLRRRGRFLGRRSLCLHLTTALPARVGLRAVACPAVGGRDLIPIDARDELATEVGRHQHNECPEERAQSGHLIAC